ncbi:MAG: hypothetical protein ACJA01_000687 [Saprospiraceae bacterium]
MNEIRKINLVKSVIPIRFNIKIEKSNDKERTTMNYIWTEPNPLRLSRLCGLFLILSLISCSNDEFSSHFEASPQFRLLSGDETGLKSINALSMTAEFNVFEYMNFFNGGGVAVGDFNKDGLEDIFLARNLTSNKIYLNEGNLKFKDVTKEAQLEGEPGFTTGTSVVDINNDGMLDIYVGQLGDISNLKGNSQLYICKEIINGIPIFENRADEYGIAFSGLAQQATFFDYDQDGDLDMYQLNQSVHQAGISRGRKNVPVKDDRSGDRLLRNDSEGGIIKFSDVTLTAGIQSTALGFGLGIATGDVNFDGWPDIYVCNDFHENDYLYINQGDGTFKESVSDYLRHTSRFSMGVDIADINNDGLSEIYSLDMLAEDPYILKTSLGEDGYDVYQLKLSHGFNYQYSRNNLQLNNGNGTFSEIGIFAGVHATDWSWSPLFMDFDHDGLKDLFVSNGIPRRMNNIDYVNFKLYGQPVKDTDNKSDNINVDDPLGIINNMPQIKLHNKFFLNNGNLKFKDIYRSISDDKASYSNGAAYADLDNDGDLDIITNNIDDTPFIYQNLTVEKNQDGAHFINIRFKGSPRNINSIGAKVIIEKGDDLLTYEHFPVKGYMSSVALGLHIGLGDTSSIGSITIIWPDGTYDNLEDREYNEVNVIEWKEGLPKYNFHLLQEGEDTPYALIDISDQSGLKIKHTENWFVEFNKEALMPHMVSREGPSLASGDINGDGLEDVLIGGARDESATILIQDEDGLFLINPIPAIEEDAQYEDVDALIIDIDLDGDPDIIMAGGDNEVLGARISKQNRVYLNDGTGQFSRIESFPEASVTASCIVDGDFNNDGLPDFFIGGRANPGSYGTTPKSFLYKNLGNAQFQLVTPDLAPELEEVGMVKDANWTDIDNDGDQDLVLALEWDALQIFINNNGHLKKKSLNNLKGWWNFILTHDFDQDGDIDILAGNLGANSKFHPTKEEPVRCYIDDYDNNGQLDQIITYYLKGREYLFHTHEELVKQLPALKRKYLYASDLAKATIQEIFGKQTLEEALTLEANFMLSAWFENKGNLEFKTHPLPDALQYSSLESGLIADIDRNGHPEIILGGNFHECNIEMGRYDADYGNILSIRKDKTMKVYPMRDTPIKGQIRKITTVKSQHGDKYIFARNDDFIKVLQRSELIE